MPKQTVPKANRSTLIHGLLYTFLVVSLFALAYLNFLDSKSADTVRNIDKQCESFEALPHAVKRHYMKRIEYKKLEDNYFKLEAQLYTTKDDTLESNSTLQSENSEISNTSKSDRVIKVKDFAHCYEMDNASFSVSASCRQVITDYVDKYKDAKYFEIIGVVDNLEFNLFNNLESHQVLYRTLGVNQRVIDKMKKLTRRGLSKERASEISWVIKTHTKMKAATYNANYEIVSKKNQRGVIVRAYR